MKKTVKILLGIGITLSLLVLGFFAVKNEVYSGATILGINYANYISSSSELRGNSAFLIDAVVNKGGESLKATISPETLKEYGIETLPAGDISVEFNLKDVKCNYQVTAENEIIYSIYQATVRKSLCSPQCGNNGCTDQSSCPYSLIDLNTVKKAFDGQWGAKTRTYWSGTTVHSPEYCNKIFAPAGSDLVAPGNPVRVGSSANLVDIQKVPANLNVGADPSEWCYAMPREIMAGFDGDHWEVTHIAGMPLMEGYKIGTTPSVSYLVEVIVRNDKGQKVTANLTEKQTSQFLGDIGRIKWVGSLVAQEYCGQPAIDTRIVKMLDTGSFKQVNRDLYQRYQDNLQELVDFDNNYYSVAGVDPGLGKDVLNSKMSSLNSDFNKLYAQNLTSNCKLNNMIYECTPEKDLIYPEVQLLLKADWVGIVLPNGDPQIKSVKTADKIYDGEASIITTEIKNIGKEVDSFDISINCDRSVGIGSQRASIVNDETKQILIPFSATTGTYSCDLVVASVNNPNNKDIEQFTFTVLARDIPTVQQCEKKDIPNEIPDGSYWIGYPYCMISTPKEKVDWTWYIVGIITILFLIVIYFITRKNSGRKRR